MSTPASELTDRDRAICYLREIHGWDLDRIGKLFGITRERVRQIVSKVKYRLREIPDVDAGV